MAGGAHAGVSVSISKSAWNKFFPQHQQAHKGALVADIGRCMGLTVMYTCVSHRMQVGCRSPLGSWLVSTMGHLPLHQIRRPGSRYWMLHGIDRVGCIVF